MFELLNNRYKILRTLGSGGFGDTFLAEDTHMPSHRSCVIKQLRPITNNQQVYQIVQERFQREAAILETLGEENSQIPKLYAYFTEEGKFYLVQEWVNGSTLGDRLHQGTLSEDNLKTILLQLLPVLDSIHTKGIIHRDIKPDNIILRHCDGLPVLIDFGAVKETMGTQVNSQGNSTSSIVIGTPGFMPSEQAAGRPVFSSDLYSLGLTLIYLLTGKLPQELETDSQTGEIIWRQYATNVSSQLVEVLDKAIKSHPRDRFPTAKAMLEALQGNPNANPIPPTLPAKSPIATPPPHPKSRLILLASILIGGLVSAAIGAEFFLKPSPSPQPVTINNSQQQTLPPLKVVPVEPPLQTISPETVEDTRYEWLSSRKVTELDLIGRSAQELSIMRNSIFARKGRTFNNQELQQYFNSQPWYRPLYSPDEFPDRLISSLEEENAAYILDYQNRNDLRWIY